jgi:predicted transcriptional regulator
VEHQLSDQQLAFLRVLWQLGEAGVTEVQAALVDEGQALAPTTVATVLGRLEKKGLVEHRSQGRQYLYRAVVSEQEVRRSVLTRVTDTLFGGDATALVSQLIDQGEVSPSDLAEVEALLRARSKDNEGGR